MEMISDILRWCFQETETNDPQGVGFHLTTLYTIPESVAWCVIKVGLNDNEAVTISIKNKAMIFSFQHNVIKQS